MKPKFINYFMKIADVTAELSYAKRLRVGAVLVKDNKILGTGYNGMPSGWENNCENKEYMSRDAGGWLDPEEIEMSWPFEELNDQYDFGRRYRLKTKPEVLHAESNAIAKVSGSTESSENATMFCTHAPCIHCAKMIWQSGIKNLYYRDTYRDSGGLEFLNKSGVNVHKHTNIT